MPALSQGQQRVIRLPGAALLHLGKAEAAGHCWHLCLGGWPSPAGDNRGTDLVACGAGAGEPRQLTGLGGEGFMPAWICSHLLHLCPASVPARCALVACPGYSYPLPGSVGLQSPVSPHLLQPPPQLIFSTVHFFISTKQSHAIYYDCGYHHQHYLSNTSQGWDLG